MNEKDAPSRKKFTHLTHGNKLVPCTDVADALEAILEKI